ncbi:PPOX class F420-dependent oxidoreductase [Kribbella catacumbae]|uniref:PPOX class F420-dependent oxidoreductase n=1 Tax=Kribbella catacumbae TaxID=460086 RepID=UPI0004757244|nr:PPOX class F420-dependent oxidoreductase [Kribbella catacumbae]
MSSEEIRAFLTTSPRTLKVATVRTDGTPHVAPVWFVLDGDDIVFSTPSRSVKARNLRANQRVCICVDDEQPPFGFISATGSATLHLRPDDLVHWTTRIARRYLGDQAAPAAGKLYAEIDDLLVRIRVTAMVARAGIAD